MKRMNVKERLYECFLDLLAMSIFGFIIYSFHDIEVLNWVMCILGGLGIISGLLRLWDDIRGIRH